MELAGGGQGGAPEDDCVRGIATRRRNAAPLQSAEFYRQLVDSSQDAIISKDANAVITSWNQGAERLYGYSPEEAVGRPLSIIVPPERRGEEFTMLEEIMAA